MTYNYCSWNIILLVCRNRTFFSSVSLITLSDRKLKSDIFELTRWYRNYFFFHLFQKHFSTQGKSWSRCNVVSISNRKQRSQNASKVRKQTKKKKQNKKKKNGQEVWKTCSANTASLESALFLQYQKRWNVCPSKLKNIQLGACGRGSNIV